ncbi:hypothetical protein C8R45DRAFT_944595 [Mycena sanguinolenta]|nr:hypothetical protein C8R45DRAFT_944595 [Mycena sanguinolenta]
MCRVINLDPSVDRGDHLQTTYNHDSFEEIRKECGFDSHHILGYLSPHVVGLAIECELANAMDKPLPIWEIASLHCRDLCMQLKKPALCLTRARTKLLYIDLAPSNYTIFSVYLERVERCVGSTPSGGMFNESLFFSLSCCAFLAWNLAQTGPTSKFFCWFRTGINRPHSIATKLGGYWPHDPQLYLFYRSEPGGPDGILHTAPLIWLMAKRWQIPQKLTDKIINVVHSDPYLYGYPMIRCSFISKRWGRSHLFSTICIDADNLGELVDIVASSPWPILSFVRYIRLRYVRDFNAAKLAQIHHCPNLSTLNIGYSGWSGEENWLGAQESFQSHIRAWSKYSQVGLSCLEINSPVANFPMGVVLDLLACIPGVDNLAIWGAARLLPQTPRNLLTQPAPPHLTHVVLDVHEPGFAFISWMCSCPGVPPLKSLQFSAMLDNAKDEEVLEEYFKSFGYELESISIYLFGLTWEGQVAFHKRILRYTPRLKNIAFRCQYLFNILEMIAIMPESLEWDAIDVGVNDFASSDEKWIDLDRALAAPKFIKLRRFSVNNERTCVPPFTDEVRKLMPLATAHGILL